MTSDGEMPGPQHSTCPCDVYYTASPALQYRGPGPGLAWLWERSDDSTEYDWTLEAAAPQQQSKPNLPSGLDFDAITEQSCAELQLPVNP